MVIFTFPSEQATKNWYADADYQALSEHRRDGIQLDFLTMVRGCHCASKGCYLVVTSGLSDLIATFRA